MQGECYDEINFFWEFPTRVVIVSESVYAHEPAGGVRCCRRRDGILRQIHSKREVSRLLRSQVRTDDGEADFERRRGEI